MKVTLLLIALTLLVVLLPLLPALEEWRRPTDVTPLPIDEADALEPDYMARRFAARLDEAVGQSLISMGNVPLVVLTREAVRAPWPLDEREARTGRTRRIWHTEGDCALPERLHGLAEISARGAMRTAPRHAYRALLSGGQLALAERVRVMRWAHGHRVSIADRCSLPGRVTADEVIMVGREVSFSLLHAPAIRFTGLMPEQTTIPPTGWWSIGRAEGVTWDATRMAGHAARDLHVPPLRRWTGELTVQGHLSLGEGCIAQGTLRASGSISVAAGCKVLGGMVSPGEIYLAAGTEVQSSIVSERAVVLGPGCVIGVPGAHATVRAPRVDIGRGVVVHGTVWSGSRMITVGRDSDIDADLAGDSLDREVRWNEISGRGLAVDSLTVSPRRRWSGDLVCQGDLEIGHRCHAGGSLKAYGDLGLGAGSAVEGSVVAQGEVLVGAGARVGGSLLSESAVVLGPGCVVGTPQRPATVCAPRIEVGVGVVVHGTLWAGHTGDAMGSVQAGDADGIDVDGLELRLPGRAAA